jgi:hypothetical protein
MENRSVKYGLYIPNFGKSTHPRTLANLAFEAEKAGWDGFSYGITWSSGSK